MSKKSTSPITEQSTSPITEQSSGVRAGAAAVPAGLVAALALVATLVGALLWARMLTSPAQLVTGLLGARDHLDRAEDKLADGLLKKARFETLAGVAAARRAEQGWRAPSPLLDLARLSPQLEEPLGETGHLVTAARSSAAAAADTLTIAQDALEGPNRLIVSDAGDPGGSRIRIERVVAVGRLIDGIRGHLGSARSELEAIEPAALPRRFRSAVARGIARARRAQLLLADAAAGFDVLPAFLGANEPRHYLLAMQNSAELRGTGGAMLRFSPITIDEGRLELDPDNSVYDIDKNRRPISIPLPRDAWYVRAIEDAQRFGNANWSPDWPLTSKLTLAYGEASSSRFGDFDGVIGVDPTLMQQLIPGTGSFKTSAQRKVTADKVVPLLLNRAYATYPIPGQRRLHLRAIVKAFYAALLDPRHPNELVTGMGRALANKHMQMWVDHPKEQAFIERMDWDGAIEEADGSDYVNVVEQNVGGNKLNYFESMSNEVDVSFAGTDALVSTKIRIANEVVLPQARYFLGDSDALHRPMLNLYVPGDAIYRGAEALGTTELFPAPSPAIWSNGRPPEHSELGKKIFSATLEIPPRAAGAVRFDYRVPRVVVRRGQRQIYRIMLQHQPKVRPETMTVRLTLPPRARRVRAPGWERRGRSLVWERSLDEDTMLEVAWWR